MLSKIIPILSLFMFASCSKSYNRLNWLHSYIETDNQRSIASTEKACFIDQFEIDHIKNEITLLEKNWKTKVKIPEKFRFTTFNNAQTHYISRYHKYITLNDEGKKCNDLPCILNTAYGNNNGEEGYRIYHWFLTMQSGISTSRNIPGFADEETKKLKDYLFPNRELKFFNIMSKTLSAKYKNIFVSTIHRFPNGTSPGTNVAGRYNPTWSYSPITKVITTKNPSSLFLTDQNLSQNENNKTYQGYYRQTFVHEFTHALDFFYGQTEHTDRPMMSDQKQWTDFSWKWGEVAVIEDFVGGDVQTSDKESIIMGWVVDETKVDGFLRPYQRTDPGEDFADSGSHFLFNPESFQKTSPNKYAFFKEKFYFNKGFVKNELINEKVGYISNDLKKSLWEIVKSCLVDRVEFYGEAKYIKLDQYRYLGENQSQCLINQIENFIGKELYLIKKNEYYGCAIAKESSKDIHNKVLQNIEIDLGNYIEKLDDYKEIQKVWLAYRSELKNKCDPAYIFLDVRKSINPKEKYYNEFNSCLEQVHINYPTYGELLIEEKQNYLDAHKFEDVKDKTLYEYSQMMLGFKTNLKRSSEELVASCTLFQEEELNNTGLVMGPAIYVNASVLNCINNNFYAKLDAALYDFLNDKYALLESGLLYITETYQNVFVHMINEELRSINQMEENNSELVYVDGRKEIFSFLYNDDKFLSQLVENKKNKDFCLLEGKSRVQDVIVNKWKSERWPQTISLNELSNTLVDIICPELLEVSSNKHQDELEKVNSVIKDYIHSKINEQKKWIEKIKNEQNFIPICQEENSYHAKIRASSIVSENNLIFVSPLFLQKHISDNLCKKLNEKFLIQLKEIKEQSVKYSKRVTHNLDTLYSWQIALNKENYIHSCMIFAQTQLDKEFLHSDLDLNLFDLLSTSLMLKFLSSDACNDMSKQWENKHLVQLKSYMKASEREMYANTNFQNSDYKQYMDSYLKEINSLMSSNIQQDYEVLVNECKNKHPYVRYASIKIKRKQCIMKFFDNYDEAKYISINNSTYHPVIRFLVLSSSKTVLESIKNNINEHLK